MGPVSRSQTLDELLARVMGLDADTIGGNCIARAVDRLMAEAGILDPEIYCDRLKSSQTELEKLIEELVVAETWFFRDQEPFACLRDFVKTEWLPRRLGRPLRVLSAPCSTGEEPYSIAITLLDSGLAPESFIIDAVDISGRALERARHAVYRRSSFRGPSAEVEAWRDRHFMPVPDGLQLRPEIRDLVRFSRDNLLHATFVAGRTPYDVIFCKNLIIYLHDDARQRLLANLKRLLQPDGILFTGHVELLLCQQAGFAPVNYTRAFACRKAPPQTKAPAPAPARQPTAVPPPAPRPEPEPGVVSIATIRALADSGRLQEASMQGEELLKATPADPDLLCLLGVVCQALDRPDEAENYFRKTLYLAPEHYEALVHLGNLCAERGEVEQAALFRERAARAQDEVRH